MGVSFFVYRGLSDFRDFVGEWIVDEGVSGKLKLLDLMEAVTVTAPRYVRIAEGGLRNTDDWDIEFILRTVSELSPRDYHLFKYIFPE